MIINNYVNIGIVTFNRLEFTRQAIASIVKYTSYPHTITVVDNGSSDGTQEYLNELKELGLVKNVLLLESNIGVAKASNIAWKQEPNSLYYLKYDNDIVVEKNNWLSNLVSISDAVPEIGVIGYNFEQKSYPIRVINNCQLRVKEEGNIGGACFLVPKRTHDLLGYWCEEYGLYGFEDCDYSFRVQLSGLLNAYMEDENIGIHLPAGRAPIVNGATWQSSDGIEEFEYAKYRDFKDLQMKDSIGRGLVSKKFADYQNKKCSLYACANISSKQTNLMCPGKISDGIINMSANQLDCKPFRIDIGCGISKKNGFVGVDVCDGPGVDIVADLNKVFPFEDNSIDEIKAHDVIEHLHDRLHTMNEIWRVCKDGALIDIRVPSTDGRGAFQDPTHVSFWNINSFMYYSNDFPAYLELCQRYGFKGEFKILHLDHEESSGQVIHVIAKLQVVKKLSEKYQHQASWSDHLVKGNSRSENQSVIISSPINILSEESISYKIQELNENINEYKKQINNRAAIAKIRQSRYVVGNLLLGISESTLYDIYTEKNSTLRALLLDSDIQSHVMTITEKSFVDRLNQRICEGSKEPKILQHLSSALLYCHTGKLRLDHDLSHIPDWFIQDYLAFIFSCPTFESVKEVTDYYDYIHAWVDYLHVSIFANYNNPFWQNVAGKFAQIANFIPVYFTEHNLKDMYVKRAEIISFHLSNHTGEIGYDVGERPVNRKKIRLGVISSHFNPSAETFAALPVYEYLSREFEVVLYSLQQTNHPLEQYCQSSANFFVTLSENLAEQVNAIRSDDLDILFFATNITAVTNQMCLLASHRLARIQVTSGGSVVTTGMKNMDYFISGTFTDPSPTAQEQYQEELIQLPGAAHCFSYGDFEEKSSLTIDRENLGIPDDIVVFTSGANFYKIIPELIHTWAKIIAAVPNSVLMLFPFGPNWSSNYPKETFEQHLHKIFAEYGVSPDRVIALDPQPVPNREDLKEYYKLADVYLDSYPFAGTTSLIEPLQVNLPVIARQGDSFRSSMGAAMIRSLEISELVADSEESYIQLAVALGNNSELRQQKSAEVKAKMADNPSFLDSKGYGAKIGELFKELVDRYSRNALSDNLRLKDVNLMVFPDWSQSEESVGLELQQVIQTLATQPDAQKTTLLIDTTNIAIEDAEMFLSSVAMNLMMEEDLDIMEELEISLIEDLNNIQWDNLLPRISARIVLECDNQEVVGKLPHEKLPQRQLESFVLS
jgi:predicted O-linked N-acetylglucosamine transferase (SPINDLY family)/glycosyltransferase involved in cell wall biosynthesis